MVLAAGEIDAFDLMGVVVNDPGGLTHQTTWGLITAYPTVIPVAAATVFRWAIAARLDTTAVANLASAALMPLRGFAATDAQVGDKAWKSRRYWHQSWPAGGSVANIPLSPPAAPAPDSQVANWSVRRLGTIQAGEGWYLYIRNSSTVGITVQLDLQTSYLLA